VEYKTCFFSENVAFNYSDFIPGMCSRIFSPKILLSNPNASYTSVPLHSQGNRFGLLRYRVARNVKLSRTGKIKGSANLNETCIHYIEHYIGLCVEHVLSSVD
jgi:hypothetical protein